MVLEAAVLVVLAAEALVAVALVVLMQIAASVLKDFFKLKNHNQDLLVVPQIITSLHLACQSLNLKEE